MLVEAPVDQSSHGAMLQRIADVSERFKDSRHQNPARPAFLLFLVVDDEISVVGGVTTPLSPPIKPHGEAGRSLFGARFSKPECHEPSTRHHYRPPGLQTRVAMLTS